MIVKFIDAPGVAGGKAIALCGDDGVMLPLQVRAVLENGVGEAATITVTFRIDGKTNRMVE